MNVIVTLTVILIGVTRVARVSSDGLSVFPKPIVEETEDMAFEKLSNMESRMFKTLKENVDSIATRLYQRQSTESGKKIEITLDCMNSILDLVYGFLNMEYFAYSFMDSQAIPGGGILRGTPGIFGSYSQCVNTVFPMRIKDRKLGRDPVTGQYCILKIRPPLPPKPDRLRMLDNVFTRINATFKTEIMSHFSKNLFGAYDTPFKVGLCVPSSCSYTEINQLIKSNSGGMPIHLDLEFCQVKEPFALNTLQITIMAILGVIVLINVVASVWDEVAGLMRKGANGTMLRIIGTFSIRKNAALLFGTKEADERSLDFLNGVRFLSLTWILLGHSYSANNHYLLREYLNAKNMIENLAFQVVLKGFLAVSTFFFISSFLLSYHLVRHYDSTKRFTPFLVIVKRILRLFPSLALFMAIVMLLPAFGSGPFFKENVEDQTRVCKDKWWKTLLFIGNFDYMNQMCYLHLWYVSAEFQYFLIGIIYFFILFKSEKLGKLFLSTMVLFSVVSTGFITYYYDDPPTAYRNVDFKFNVEYAKRSYTTPHVYLGVYAIGLFTGTYLARNPSIKISMPANLVGWAVSVPSALAVIYCVYPWNRGEPYTAIESILYTSMHRIAWTLCLAFLSVSCYSGRAGVVNSILSWPAFQPLVRLSYLTYLFHYPILFFYSEISSGATDISHQVMVFRFFGTLVSTSIVAAILRILFESPIARLQAMFFQGMATRAKANANKYSDSN